MSRTKQRKNSDYRKDARKVKFNLRQIRAIENLTLLEKEDNLSLERTAYELEMFENENSLANLIN